MLKFIQNFLVMLAVFVLIQNTAFSDMIEFAQVGDVHYTLGDDISDKYLYFLSSSLRKKSPEFVVFLGDNVDKSKEENVIGFMCAIHSINFPYYIVLGKNDAHSFSGLEKEIYLDIVSAFNSNQDSKKKYYFFLNSYFSPIKFVKNNNFKLFSLLLSLKFFIISSLLIPL